MDFNKSGGIFPYHFIQRSNIFEGFYYLSPKVRDLSHILAPSPFLHKGYKVDLTFPVKQYPYSQSKYSTTTNSDSSIKSG